MRIYLWKDLRAAGVPYVRKHVRTLERRAEFPIHFNIGPNRVAWSADEVDAWVEERVRTGRSASTLKTEEFPQLSNLSESVPRNPADVDYTVAAEILRTLAAEAAARGVTPDELIRRIVETHDRTVRIRRRGAAEAPLNT
jgi:hypothetical protein